MSETVNIGEIANKLSDEIFSSFGWECHPRRDQDFPCQNETHTIKVKNTRKKKGATPEAQPKQKQTHPGDVVFFYQDPYLKRRIYLHTDLKSYGKDSVTTQKLRPAIESLAMSVNCAQHSENWRTAYSVPEEIQYEVRGLLFVHNHDNKYQNNFDNAVAKTDLGTLSIAPNVYVHFLGPHDINRLFTIANDIIRLQHQRTLPERYSFYYPDLIIWRRQGDIYKQPATIETITAPYMVITYETGEKTPPGSLIYYNRAGATADEFVYFLDSLSRCQMLEPGKLIRIRVVSMEVDENLLSNFDAARTRYARAWGFDEARRQVLDEIKVERVTAVASSFSAGFIGWRPN